MTLPIHKVGFTITTSDDDTLDIVMDALEEFGKTTLRDILSIHDPLATVILDSSDGLTIKC